MTASRPPLRGFHDLADVIAVAVDASGRVQFVNPFGARLLGYEETELIGRDWFEISLPEWERERLRTVFQAYLGGDTESVERFQNAVLTKHNDVKIINWHNRPQRDAEGRINGIFSVGIDVTELVESASREKALGSILENTLSEIYIVDLQDLQIIHGNKTALHNMGYSLAELKCLAVPDLLVSEERKKVAQHLAPLLEGQQKALSLELTHRRRDGSSYAAEASFTLSHYDNAPALVIYCQDVSARKRYQQELEVSKARYKTILDTAIDAIVTVGEDGRVQSFNRSAERIFGYRAEEVMHREVQTLVAEPKLPDCSFGAGKGVGERNLPHRSEVIGRHKDGTEIPLEIAKAAVNDGQRVIVTAVIRDLTERRKAERALREKEKELQQTRDQLLHFDRVFVVNEMATGIAHEIKQPLSAISTYANVCRRLLKEAHLLDDDIHHALSQIHTQAERAGDVVRSVRNLMQKDAGDFTSVDPNRILEQSLELAGAQLRAHGIEVEMQAARDLPPAVANVVQIQQVILNLLQNAMDALTNTDCPVKKINIKTALAADSNVKLSIVDNGGGIPESRRKQIFQPFYSTKTTGMGLGLSICRSIIEAHGGELHCASDNNSNTEFYFTLPIDTKNTRGAEHGTEQTSDGIHR